MAQHKIEVLIDEDGNPTITVKGLKGKACQKITTDLIADFGGEVISDVPTAEMAQQETGNVKVTAR